jgi:hypothetical protein
VGKALVVLEQWMGPEFEAGVVRRRGWWVPNFGQFLHMFGSRMGDVEGVRGVSDGGGTDGAGFDPGGGRWWWWWRASDLQCPWPISLHARLTDV